MLSSSIFQPRHHAVLECILSPPPNLDAIALNLFYLIPSTAGFAVVAMLNIFGVRLVAFLNDVSVGWHIVGVILIVVGVVVATLAAYQFNPGAGGVAPAVQVTGSAVHGLNSGGTLFAVNQAFNLTGFPIWYAFLLSLLLAQYTYTGYEASAHMTEETVGAATRAPWGVVMSVVVSAVAGYALLMGLLAAAPDLAASYSFVNPVLYILESRLSFALGTLLFAVIFVAQFFCSMSSVTWCQLLPKLRNNDGQKKFLPPFLHTASSRFSDNRTG